MDRDTPDFIQTREPESSSSNESRCHGRHVIWSLQLLLSLSLFSLFSLFISYMTGISFLYSYTYYYFSTFLLPAATHALERKYMFILCNSLVLVFTRGFHGSVHHDHTEFDEILVSKDDEELYAIPRMVEDDEEDVKADEDVGVAETETEVIEEDLEEDEEGRKDEDDGDVRGEVDKEVVTVGCGTDEELNRKFEEFIRKMKEELRLEAQQYHLIAA